MSSDTTWRRGVERLASTVGIGADQLAAFEQELYDLKSEYESWKRNDPGPTAAARRKLETLRRGLKDALNEYVSLGQGITIKYW